MLPKIYKIINDVDNLVYVGSTALEHINNRMRYHKSDMKRTLKKNFKLYKHMNNIGVNNFKIILLETINTNDKKEIYKRERYWINFYNSINNGLNEVNPIKLEEDKNFIINCYCGKKYKISSKYNHNKSIIHKDVEKFYLCNNILNL